MAHRWKWGPVETRGSQVIHHLIEWWDNAESDPDDPIQTEEDFDSYKAGEWDYMASDLNPDVRSTPP